MLESQFSKECIAVRREMRDLPKDGFSLVSEGSIAFRNLPWDHTITEVRIARGGRGVWIKSSPRFRPNP